MKCWNCGKKFTPKRRWQVYCGAGCRKAFWSKARVEGSKEWFEKNRKDKEEQK